MADTLTLRDYGAELAEVVGELLENGGELTEELEARLAVAEQDFTTKAERVGLKVRELQLNAQAVQAEADRLAARAKALTGAADSLKDYLHHQLLAAGTREAKGLLLTVRVQNNAPAARCSVDPAALPDHLVRIIPPQPEQRVFDSKAALAAHKAGQELPAGVEVVQGTHVRLY